MKSNQSGNSSSFYDTFSRVYDVIVFKHYYKKSRAEAAKKLRLEPGQKLLYIACGTGQGIEDFQQYLNGSGLIIGMDYSKGMLEKAAKRIKKHKWDNIVLIHGNAEDISASYLKQTLPQHFDEAHVDAAVFEFGLTAMPNWKKIIDNTLAVLKKDGRIVILDWYMKKPNLWGRFINWIGDADISRQIWQYLKRHCNNFQLDDHFHNGGVFLASGTKK